MVVEKVTVILKHGLVRNMLESTYINDFFCGAATLNYSFTHIRLLLKQKRLYAVIQ